MIKSVLIANRGEIACRVISTARRLGMNTVAVFSDEDRAARHVSMADRAVRIGTAPVSDSYLCGDRIIKAALETGADAIHPGYGFLSENPDFVAAVADAGLIFIGPPAAAIRAMGLKDAAKSLMEHAGVPVVPGYHGENQDPDFLAQQADAIGYPVLIKARAGGGGKGMRLVQAPTDFADALTSAQREASAAFGDPACLIEKFIQSPRHIEIQVFADTHGNCIHLFERDCSLQRRHQKVIEEAPAPGMPEPMRQTMGDAAINAAKSIGYVGAGTVEFIVDSSQGLHPDKFWFMEMNTRLQVEHPVTEAITGLDFVELQLRVADGAPLPVTQDQLQINGHAFEARIYSEDATAGFLPAIGTLEHLHFPAGTTFANGPVRIDSGVRQGDAVSPHYDPMIAKLIAHGPDRDSALQNLQKALVQTRIGGTVSNLQFLSSLAKHEGFAKGQVDTGLIARDMDALLIQPAPKAGHLALAGIGALGLLAPCNKSSPWTALRGLAAWSNTSSLITLMADTTPCNLRVDLRPDACFLVQSDDGTTEIQVLQSDGDHVSYRCNDQIGSAHVAHIGSQIVVWADGHKMEWTVPDPLAQNAENASGGDNIKAPMPGLVKLINVAPGDTVTQNDIILVLEAMKMEHSLRAPRDGTLADILTQTGAQVFGGDLLAVLEPVE